MSKDFNYLTRVDSYKKTIASTLGALFLAAVFYLIFWYKFGERIGTSIADKNYLIGNDRKYEAVFPIDMTLGAAGGYVGEITVELLLRFLYSLNPWKEHLEKFINNVKQKINICEKNRGETQTLLPQNEEDPTNEEVDIAVNENGKLAISVKHGFNKKSFAIKMGQLFTKGVKAAFIFGTGIVIGILPISISELAHDKGLDAEDADALVGLYGDIAVPLIIFAQAILLDVGRKILFDEHQIKLEKNIEVIDLGSASQAARTRLWKNFKNIGASLLFEEEGKLETEGPIMRIQQ